MKRSKFSLSNSKLMSGDMGELLPCGVLEVLPGDTMQHATTVLLRASPLLAPVMHPVDMRVHTFFVPNRLIWDDFEDFITGGPDGLDASVHPKITLATGSTADIGGLADYMGCPTGVNGLQVSALPFRAYNLIYNEWYRDQDLQTELAISTASGADATTAVGIENVCWEKDYFTSARPWEQKGTDVSIPLTGNPPVYSGADAAANNTYADISTGASKELYVDSVAAGQGSGRAMLVDLSSVSGVDMNDLLEALALQDYQEARARYGSRYVEYLLYLGVNPSDARLMRPELVGTGRQTIQFSEVLQTAPTTSGSDAGVADIKGHGIGALRAPRYRRYFEEHGLLMSLISVRPRTMYHQGLSKMWFRDDKTDYFQKEFEAIGQEEVYNKEVYAAHTTPDGVFGYSDRYESFRRIENTIAGEFRDTTLNFWHLARGFSSDPSLNDAFVTCTPSKRIHAVQSNDVLWMRVHHSIQARRQLSRSPRRRRL